MVNWCLLLYLDQQMSSTVMTVVPEIYGPCRKLLSTYLNARAPQRD